MGSETILRSFSLHGRTTKRTLLTKDVSQHPCEKRYTLKLVYVVDADDETHVLVSVICKKELNRKINIFFVSFCVLCIFIFKAIFETFSNVHA
jgi:hypothetical protein